MSGRNKIIKHAVYLRLLIISIVGALVLSLISLFCLVIISDVVIEDYRYGYMMYIGRKIEKSSKTISTNKLNVNLHSAPPIQTKDALTVLKATDISGPEPKKNQKTPQPSLWLISEKGLIISSTTKYPLPTDWEKLPHPNRVHEMENTENYILAPKTYIIKLNTVPKTFLVTHNPRTLFQGPFLWIQGLHTFTTAALAVFLALSICFYYLRKKSDEAREVLGKLESGDLKSRFEIKKFDEFGNLILDFNRMADEIERLVKRLNDTERSRSNLLQELGHDLRTPLTSLGTSFEAIKSYHDQLSDEERNEVFTMIEADIRYFKDLLEKLTIIATIDESQYKSSSEKIDLKQMLGTELRNRQTGSGIGLIWELKTRNDINFNIFGDIHLISRLFKNAFDNAARYAKNRIRVELISNSEVVEVIVSDDGPGLTQESINSFGKRREQRSVMDQDPRNFSLGLGSVIMRTIAEVHDGEISINNLDDGGAALTVLFRIS